MDYFVKEKKITHDLLFDTSNMIKFDLLLIYRLKQEE